ncbi:MAG TPA: rod shape-determining protein MreD [Bacteroidia bacterium]|nr:rod shape-determining protein MreD [Bacteroidia bacterium]
MITELILFISRFIILIAIQVAVLNHIQFSGYINPFLYISFIMILPVRLPKGLLLVIAFVAGLVMDVFTDTLGMHAAACVMMAYVRPGLLKLMAPRDGYETESYPSVRELGFTWFLIYAATLTFVHHFVLFYIEVFRFSEFFSTFLRVILSSLATLLLIMISQYLFGKAVRER